VTDAVRRPLAFGDPLKDSPLEALLQEFHYQRLGTFLRHRGAKGYILWGEFDFLQKVLDPSSRDVKATSLN
jgi:hypothetical protein